MGPYVDVGVAVTVIRVLLVVFVYYTHNVAERY